MTSKEQLNKAAQAQAVVDLSTQIYLRLISTMVYDETPAEQIASMSYECAKAYYATVPELLAEDLRNDENQMQPSTTGN